MAPKRIRSCKGDSLPEVKLAMERTRCLAADDLAPRLSDPSTIARFAVEHFGCEPQERMLGFYLNSRNELLSVQVVSVGGLDQAHVDPRVLFAGAILSGATAIILVHNHPSGDAEPSAADVSLTKQLKDSARLLAIRLLDHIVIARGGKYTSMVSRGLLSFDGALGDYGDEEIEYDAGPAGGTAAVGSYAEADEREDASTQCDTGYHERCIEAGCPCSCHRSCSYPQSPLMRRAAREDLDGLIDPVPVRRRRR